MSTVHRPPLATTQPPQQPKPLPPTHGDDHRPPAMKQPKPQSNDNQNRRSSSSSPIPKQNGVETGVGEERSSGEEEKGGKVKAKKDKSQKAKELGNSSSSPVAMYGSYIQPVPVIIVGSHYDQLESHRAEEAVRQTQQLVAEMREQFCEYLDISEQLYPLNCLKSVSPEIRALKGELCTVRSKLVEVRMELFMYTVCQVFQVLNFCTFFGGSILNFKKLLYGNDNCNI